MNPVTDIGARVLVFILLAVGFYLLMRSISFVNAARRNMNRIIMELHEKDEKRVMEAEAERRRYGTTSGSEKGGAVAGILKKLDNRLVYSELSLRHTWLNASVYLIASLIAAAASFLAGLLLANAVAGALLAAAAVAVPYAYVCRLADKNYHNTELQLSFFINLVASNSAASGDILTVLELSAGYVTSPVRGAVYRAISTARLSGKADDAVWQLTREIEHPIFVNFIRNLDICAKHDADFRVVAKDFTAQAEQSIAALEKLRAIFDNARNEILLMTAVGVILSFLVAGFCGTSLITVLTEMSRSAGGMACIAAECLIYGATIIYVLTGRRR